MMDNELVHEGVKGMKWGVRHGPPYPIEDNQKKADRRAVKQERKQAVKDRRTLSDEDLNALIKRLNSEKQLKELSEKDLYPGKSQVQKVISEVGTKTITNVLATSLTVLALYAIGSKLSGKKFDTKAAGGAILKKVVSEKKDDKKDDK